MKSFIAILALVAVAAAVNEVPQLYSGGERDAAILKQYADVLPDQYEWNYETSNGIAAQEQGALKNVGREDEGIAAQGGYAYTAPNGERISVSYTADENGFQPQGSHLPTPWPIPEAIARSIAYNLANIKPDVYTQKA